MPRGALHLPCGLLGLPFRRIKLDLGEPADVETNVTNFRQDFRGKRGVFQSGPSDKLIPLRLNPTIGREVMPWAFCVDSGGASKINIGFLANQDA